MTFPPPPPQFKLILKNIKIWGGIGPVFFWFKKYTKKKHTRATPPQIFQIIKKIYNRGGGGGKVIKTRVQDPMKLVIERKKVLLGNLSDT
jgi:hypothetical protein